MQTAFASTLIFGLISSCSPKEFFYEQPTEPVEAPKCFSAALRACAYYLGVSDCQLKQYIDAEFPAEQIVKQLLRCAFIKLGCWSDTAGVREQVLRGFFQPIPGDKYNEDRTRECMKAAMCGIAAHDCASIAYETFRCYYQEFGNLIEECAQCEREGLLVEEEESDDPEIMSFGISLKTPNSPKAVVKLYVREECDKLESGIQMENFNALMGRPNDSMVKSLLGGADYEAIRKVVIDTVYKLISNSPLFKTLTSSLFKSTNQDGNAAQVELKLADVSWDDDDDFDGLDNDDR